MRANLAPRELAIARAIVDAINDDGYIPDSLEDIAATRVHQHLVPGRGAIDFPATINAIRETGYNGWLTVELYPYIDDPDAAAREAREFLLKHCGNSN